MLGVRRPPPTLAHRGVVVAVAAIVFVAAWIVAEQRPIPAIEIDAFRSFNDAPTWVARALWPVMQLGALWAPLVVALLLGTWRRDWTLAGCLAGAGAVTWIVTRIAKEVIGRGRPGAYLDDVHLHDGWARGFGFPSGHSAMAATIATVCLAAVPRRYRAVLVVVAALIGIARIVHGVHWPGDVVGGWALGVLVGVGGLEVYDRAGARGATG